MNYYSLSLLKYVETIYTNTLKFSRIKMEKSGELTQEEMKKVCEVDDSILNEFRKECIQSYFLIYPSYIRKLMPFDNWEKAMLWVRQVDKGIYPLDIQKKKQNQK